MNFEGHDVPDHGDLAPFIREQILGRSIASMSDTGDFSTLEWVERLARQSEAMAKRVADGYATLLEDDDPVVVSRIIDDGHRLPTDFASPLMRRIEEHSEALAQARDPSRFDGTTLLGTAIEALDRMGKRPYSQSLVRILGKISRPEDGWPTSLRMALSFDPYPHLPQLVSVVGKLDDEALAAFAGAMVAGGPPLTTIAFDAIGRGPLDVRQRFGAAVRAFVRQTEEAGRVLFQSGALAKLPPELHAKAVAPRPDAWPEFAARLQIPAD